jgi:hypothetical protein
MKPFCSFLAHLVFGDCRHRGGGGKGPPSSSFVFLESHKTTGARLCVSYLSSAAANQSELQQHQEEHAVSPWQQLADLILQVHSLTLSKVFSLRP